MTPALVIALGLVALGGYGGGEATGDGAESGPEIAVPDGCDSGMFEHRVAAGTPLDNGTRLRIVYVAGGALVPCAVRIRGQADEIKPIVLVAEVVTPLEPRVWCTEVTLPEANPDARVVVSRTGPESSEAAVGQAAIETALASGQDCSTVNVDTG